MTYEEKQRAVMRLNKRMRDIINKSGFNTQEFEYWQNRISGGVYKTIRTTEAYTSDDQQYSLISRRRSDIEQYSDEDLKKLEDRTRTWSQIRERVQQSMRDQNVPGGSDNAYTGERNYNNAEINDFLKMRKTINTWFEENADLVYELIEKTGWSDIHEHSTKEIYDQVKKLAEKSRHKKYNDKARDKIRSQYQAKRKKMEAKRALREKKLHTILATSAASKKKAAKRSARRR